MVGIYLFVPLRKYFHKWLEIRNWMDFYPNNQPIATALFIEYFFPLPTDLLCFLYHPWSVTGLLASLLGIIFKRRWDSDYETEKKKKGYTSISLTVFWVCHETLTYLQIFHIAFSVILSASSVYIMSHSSPTLHDNVLLRKIVGNQDKGRLKKYL